MEDIKMLKELYGKIIFQNENDVTVTYVNNIRTGVYNASLNCINDYCTKENIQVIEEYKILDTDASQDFCSDFIGCTFPCTRKGKYIELYTKDGVMLFVPEEVELKRIII